MKKVLIFILSIIFTLNISAQNFSVILDHTDFSDTLGSEIVFDFEITNNSDSDLSLYFVRKSNDLPQGWTSSLCFTFCFINDLDSIATTSSFGSSPISAGESIGFSLHVNPLETEGEGNIDILIGDMDNPNETQLFNLKASTIVTSVETDVIQNSFKLIQNYPNPFNPTTVISYQIEQPGYGSLEIFDILGNSIEILKRGYFSDGFHELKFSSKDLSSGIYFYTLKVKDIIQTKKMIVSK